MFPTAKLYNAIAAVCPVVGLSIGDRNNRATWRIDFAPEATQQQKDAAAAVIASFDPNAPQTIDELYDDLLTQGRLLKAVVLAINDGTLTVGGNRSPAQLKAIIKAKL